MNIELFSKIAKKLSDTDLDDFSCIINDKIYTFKNIGNDSWDDQGKYQYKTEKSQLIEYVKLMKIYFIFNKMFFAL